MTIKVLSGVLDTRRFASGNAVIRFSDHDISGTLSSAAYKQTLGRGNFSQTPCVSVSLREIKMHETDEAWPTGRPEEDFFRISTPANKMDKNSFQIDWEATGGSRIEEISYLVIGDTE